MGNTVLLSMQWSGIGPQLRARGKSHGLLELPRKPAEYSSVMAGKFLHRSCLFSNLELLSSYEEHLRNLLEAWQGNTDPSQSEAGDQGSLSTWHSDIGFPTIFKRVKDRHLLKP